MRKESVPDSSYKMRDTQEHDGKSDAPMVISKRKSKKINSYSQF